MERKNVPYKGSGWKGDKVKYVSMHMYIHYHYGKADCCESDMCISDNPKNFEWANLSGTYNRDIKDWKKLCIPCHKKMDWLRRYGNKCRKGHSRTEENIYKEPNGYIRCRVCRKNKGY